MNLVPAMPLLTICIATLERAECLRETMASIVPQLDSDEVELLVVDGASRDHTTAVVEGFMQDNHRVRYLRLGQKGGVDRDYDAGLRASRGEYCWFFCDDDLFEPQAVARVLSALKTDHPEVLVVDGMTWLAERDVVLVSSRLGIAGNCRFGPGQSVEMFAAVAHHLSYIGSLVIRRSLWLARDHESYVGSEFAHVGIVFQAPLPGSCSVLANPVIRIRFMNHSWAPRAFRIWMRKWPALVWSFDWVPEPARRAVVARRPWRNLPILLAHRAKGDYGMESYRTCIEDEEPSALFRLAARVVARCPERPLRALMLLVLRAFSFLPRCRLGVEALRNTSGGAH